jgi:hypothetical protein
MKLFFRGMCRVEFASWSGDARLIQDWRLLSKLEEGGRLSVAVKELERRSILSPRLSAPQLQ